MRFSENGYYIEKYLKCANCGMLVYGDGHRPARATASRRSTAPTGAWSGRRSRAAGDGYVRLPIVQPKLPVEQRPPPRPRATRRPTS